MHLVFLVIAFTLNAIANIFLKVGAQSSGAFKGLSITELIARNYLFFIGISLFVLNVVFYFLALKKLPISIAYPVMTIMSFIIINAYAYYQLSEKINVFQLVGYAFIVFGLLFVFAFAEKA